MRTIATVAIVVQFMLTSVAFATDFKVQMLNQGKTGSMVFEPNLIQAQPGDTVTFVPTDKGHNAESIAGMLPDGVEPFKGKINEQVTIVLNKEGVYGVKCTPHYGLGMVALISVGQPTNLEGAMAVKQLGLARKVFEELFRKRAAESGG
jgi:pseudoazurin